jgi:predicted DNA-binding transcriptional regulator YafY
LPEPPRRYRIRIAAARARWACEKPFHPQQQISHETDGSVILEIPRAWDNELVPQLLALGSHAEVVSPADVRDRLAAEARRILDIYQQPVGEQQPVREPSAMSAAAAVERDR